MSNIVLLECVCSLFTALVVSKLGTSPKPTSCFVVPCGFVPSSKFKPEWFVIGIGIVGKLSKSL